MYPLRELDYLGSEIPGFADHPRGWGAIYRKEGKLIRRSAGGGLVLLFGYEPSTDGPAYSMLCRRELAVNWA